MKAILYPRVSSKKQAMEGDSIDAQTSRLKQFCQDNNIEIVGIYTDAGKSASISDDKIEMFVKKSYFTSSFRLSKRPAFEKLMVEASSGKFDTIVFYKWDRFSRNPLFSGLARIYFERNNIKLIPTDDSTDSLMIQIRALLGSEEIKVKNERVRQSRLQRFEKGIMVGRAPVGYRFNKKKKIMEIDEKKSGEIIKIFELRASGKEIIDISKEMKIPYQSLKNILSNKVYYGMVEFEGKIKKGIHKPIINEDFFNKAQNGS